MPRFARLVLPGVPHHVIQRGNRRQKVFFSDEDKKAYLRILKEQSEIYGVQYWAYCLMDNHVHLIAVPEKKDSLAKGLGEAHKRYTRMINFREKWRGFLWQGRFQSTPMDNDYLYKAVRYVERNPIRAKCVKRAEDFRWSSANAHVNKVKDGFVSSFYFEAEIADWSKYLREEDDEKEIQEIRKYTQTGRPMGSDIFIKEIEDKYNISVKRRKPGPKDNN